MKTKHDSQPIGSFSPLGGKQYDWPIRLLSLLEGKRSDWLLFLSKHSHDLNSQFSLVAQIEHVFIVKSMSQNDINTNRNVQNIDSFPRNSKASSYFKISQEFRISGTCEFSQRYFFSSQRQGGYPFRSSN